MECPGLCARRVLGDDRNLGSERDLVAASREVGMASVRERMRDDFEEMYEDVKKLLKDAGEAKKQVWVNCPHCKRKSTVEIQDAKAALSVAEFFANQGFGRPAQAESESDTSISFVNKVILVADDQ